MNWLVLTLDRPFLAANPESDPGAATFSSISRHIGATIPEL